MPNLEKPRVRSVDEAVVVNVHRLAMHVAAESLNVKHAPIIQKKILRQRCRKRVPRVKPVLQEKSVRFGKIAQCISHVVIIRRMTAQRQKA
jgi:hypothetical protein